MLTTSSHMLCAPWPASAVDDAAVRSFICDTERNPYLANLVWYIGNQSLLLDEAVQDAR